MERQPGIDSKIRFHQHRGVRVGFLAFAVISLAGCPTRPNPLVCCLSQVDCASIGVDDPARVCAEGLICVDHTCTPPECEIDADCEAATPYCADLTCVECLVNEHCSVAAPTCDGTTRSCRACANDDECTSAVCDRQLGTCTESALVVYASPTGASTATCTQTDPCSLSSAFALVNAGRNVIKLFPGIYTGNFTIRNATVKVHGYNATVTAASGRTFHVIDNGHLHLSGLTIVNTAASQGIGVYCESTNMLDSPTADLFQVAVDAMLSGAFSNARCTMTIAESALNSRNTGSSTWVVTTANGGSLSIERSHLSGGDGIGHLTGTTLSITNSVLSDMSGANGAFLVGAGPIRVSFSTIYNSRVSCGTTALTCADYGLCMDNSIILNETTGAPSDTVTGQGCRFDYTLVHPQTSALIGANNLIGMNPSLKAPGEGDYHLIGGSPAIDAADPASSLILDFDGTQRPQGARLDLGAFEWKP